MATIKYARLATYDVLLRNGKERYVMVPEKDYEAMRAQVEDAADFRAIETSKRRQAKSPRTPLDEVKRELGIGRRPAGKPRAARRGGK